MDPDSSSLMQIILLIALLVLNAFFSMSEMAVVSLNDAKLSKLAREGDKKAKKLIEILDDPNDFLSTIQVGVTLLVFYLRQLLPRPLHQYWCRKLRHI